MFSTVCLGIGRLPGRSAKRNQSDRSASDQCTLGNPFATGRSSNFFRETCPPVCPPRQPPPATSHHRPCSQRHDGAPLPRDRGAETATELRPWQQGPELRRGVCGVCLGNCLEEFRNFHLLGDRNQVGSRTCAEVWVLQCACTSDENGAFTAHTHSAWRSRMFSFMMGTHHVGTLHPGCWHALRFTRAVGLGESVARDRRRFRRWMGRRCPGWMGL